MKLLGVIGSMGYCMFASEHEIIFSLRGKNVLTCKCDLEGSEIKLYDINTTIRRGYFDILISEVLLRFEVEFVRCLEAKDINIILFAESENVYSFREGMKNRMKLIYENMISDLYINPFGDRRPYLDFKLYGHPYYMQNVDYLTVFHLENINEVINANNRELLFGDLSDDEIMSIIENTEAPKVRLC